MLTQSMLITWWDVDADDEKSTDSNLSKATQLVSGWDIIWTPAVSTMYRPRG